MVTHQIIRVRNSVITVVITEVITELREVGECYLGYLGNYAGLGTPKIYLGNYPRNYHDKWVLESGHYIVQHEFCNLK